MKKRLSFKNFIICFSVIMILNAISYLNGFFNSNINSYNASFIETLFFLIGNLSIFFLIYIVCTQIKKEKNKKRFILIISFIFSLYLMILSILTNVLNFPFSFKQLTCFLNEGQSTFIVNYIRFAWNLITNIEHYIHLFSFVLILGLCYITDFSTEKINLKRNYTIFSVLFILPIIFTLVMTFHSPKNTSLYKMKSNGVYNYMVYDLLETTIVDKFDIKDSEYLEIEEYLKNHEEKTNNSFTGLLENENLLILQLEAINNMVIDLEVEGVKIMPNLSKLAHKYYYNSNFYSTSGAGNTSDCEFTTFTGLQGNGNNLTTFTYDKLSINTLAKDFEKENYYTFGSVGVNKNFYDRYNVFRKRYGFDNFYGIEDFETSKLQNHNLGDYEYLEQTFNHIKDKNNYYGHLILSTSHMPYIYNKEICKVDFKTVTYYLSNYLNYCIYVDEAIGNFVKLLEDNNLLDNTNLVIYGDHSPSLFRRDVKTLDKYKNINKIDYQLMQCNVPFVLVSSDPLLQNIHDTSCHSLNDVYNTLSNLFNLDSKYYFGSDIFTNEKSEFYNPRNSLVISDEYVFTYSNKKFYKGDYTKQEQTEIYNRIINQKRINDLILFSKVFN